MAEDEHKGHHLAILGIVAVLAVVGLVLLFKGGTTGSVTGAPTFQVGLNEVCRNTCQGNGWSAGHQLIVALSGSGSERMCPQTIVDPCNELACFYITCCCVGTNSGILPGSYVQG
ncbi:hypothetical protein J4219_00875 [Candidatus Woesearchaeota archaeon]|nr:hypothetical protein [Candidatus Woesearchaeota archaeon]